MLDEPFNGLDPKGIVWMRGFLRSHRRGPRRPGVQPPMRELQDTAGHLVVVGRGRVVADTSVADLIATASHGQVTLRTSAMYASCCRRIAARASSCCVLVVSSGSTTYLFGVSPGLVSC